MKSLEEERLRALEAAARARAEVQELSESRRKLQWQSKLLEKMSEVNGGYELPSFFFILVILSFGSPIPKRWLRDLPVPLFPPGPAQA